MSELETQIRAALTTQSIRGCACGMSEDELRAVLGEPTASGRQGKLRVLSYEPGFLVYLRARKVEAVHWDFYQPIKRSRLALEDLTLIERALQGGGTELRVGRVSLEIPGNEHVVAIHLT